MGASDSWVRMAIYIGGCLVSCCVVIIVLAIVIPIGVVNSIPPEYCSSTNHLKYFPLGSIITMQKDLGLARFNIYNGTDTTVSNRSGRMKYRSWAIPYRIDLMTADEKGSCEGRGTSFSLGQKVDLTVCQNDTEIPFQTFGKIDQEWTFILRKYKIYGLNNVQIAYAEENFKIGSVDIDIKSPDGSLVYAKLVTKPFTSILETWEVNVKAELPDFDWRTIIYLVSVISYNRS
ncbi:predicted protein [Naegleria gruberi]|uniref:Predicted protein n=1 Tax=Naegleria gruberi TaxID=5762 RepID=D2VPX0_NAEGR|nr:uncharacterized protein NAEGRDRAFT_71015 [Naegleria gruberi]EFC41279.1 predicted protein [Naegleria gruberi]|eukprot:XP_002674023.1 predicted protein [Naegleria gruberi strain NEG-M]